MISKSTEITPNFTTEQAETAEARLTDLVEHGQLLGVTAISVELTNNEIIEVTEVFGNGRVEKVRKGLAKEGLKLESLPTEVLLDRLLGIDGLIEFNGETFGIDVTTGKGTVLYNKKTKATEMESIYRQFGIDHYIVLRLRQKITDDLVLDFFGKLEDITLNVSSDQAFVHTIKYGVDDKLSS